MENLIQFLLTLQDYDVRLNDLKRNFDKIPDIICSIKTEILWNKQKITQLQTDIQDLKLNIQKAEKDLKFHEKILDKYKYKISLIKNPKEYTVLEKKISEENFTIAQIEEQTLQKIISLDENQLFANNSMSDCEKNIAKLENQLQNENNNFSQIRENILKLNNKIEKIREVIAKELPYLLLQYDKTKKSVKKMPCITKLKDGNICSGCNLKIINLEIKIIENISFSICDSCARILLLPEKVISDEI